MKKLLLLPVVALAFGSVACKKDYTCECIQVISENGVETGRQTLTSTFNATKSDAESSCNGLNVNQTLGPLTTNTTCTLK